MEFLEAPAFTRNLPRYLDDDSYSALQNALADVPDLGDVMPGTGGFARCVGRTLAGAKDGAADCV